MDGWEDTVNKLSLKQQSVKETEGIDHLGRVFFRCRSGLAN
jgi:hypothetical protein